MIWIRVPCVQSRKSGKLLGKRMGGVCSGRTGDDNATVDTIDLNFPRKLIGIPYTKSQEKDANSISSANELNGTSPVNCLSRWLPLSKATSNKRNSDVDVEFETETGENRIRILAFEVACTIAKGSNLLQSLPGPNIQILKNQTLLSEGVQSLVSTDMDELISIVSSDKRQELNLFVGEVIRFGNQCTDPKWHNLGKSILRLDSDSVPGKKESKVEAETIVQELTTLAQFTSDLYHELLILERFEQDYRRKLEEVEYSKNLASTGDSLGIFQYELNIQRRHVMSLKKKSLWSRSMDEVVEKLVKMVLYIHQVIAKAFGNEGKKWVSGDSQRLGFEGLALHYANIINQINDIASRPTLLPVSTRDNLFHALPASVRAALRYKIMSLNGKEELTVSQVKNEMKTTLQWLLPVALNTIKEYQTFGRVGEWAINSKSTGKNKSKVSSSHVLLLQTLYHADKRKTEEYILELVALLHCLISLVRPQNHHLNPLRRRSPTPAAPIQK